MNLQSDTRKIADSCWKQTYQIKFNAAELMVAQTVGEITESGANGINLRTLYQTIRKVIHET